MCLWERRVQVDYKTKKEREISEYLPLFDARPFSSAVFYAARPLCWRCAAYIVLGTKKTSFLPSDMSPVPIPELNCIYKVSVRLHICYTEAQSHVEAANSMCFYTCNFKSECMPPTDGIQI